MIIKSMRYRWHTLVTESMTDDRRYSASVWELSVILSSVSVTGVCGNAVYRLKELGESCAHTEK